MATSQLASYRPSSIVIAISHPSTGTSHIVGGMSKDSVVSIEYPDATWTEKTLNYGETVRTHSLDNTIRMTIHLDQTGWGLTPIIGADVKLGKWNIGLKYEFMTSLNLENKTRKAEVRQSGTALAMDENNPS